MEIVEPGNPAYDHDRVISNARFDYRPSFIFYCENEGDVANALSFSRNSKIPFRVRSGGHQHEGMCSGNGVAIVDLSRINHIRFDDRTGTVWLGAGAKLTDVYAAVLGRNQLFPGGGCGDVRVAGLVQGGGWGLYARALGLTCDSLIRFRMVMADGQAIEVVGASIDPRADLFWAVAGGGGGNFGVATEFQFKLHPYDGVITSLTLSWSDPGLLGPVIDEWRNHFPHADERLTTFGRLTAAGSGDAPALVSGYFLGDQPSLERILPRLLPGTYAQAKTEFTRVHEAGSPPPDGGRVFQHPEYQPGPPPAALLALTGSAEGAPGNLSSTCDGTPFPHKVSSTYPRATFGKAAVQLIVDQLQQSKPESNARRYLSLHSLGGAVRGDSSRGEWSCFAFRDKPFLLQYQAWWADRNDAPLGQRCMAWVRDFRETMAPHTEGSFINFPDKDLVPDPDTPDGRKALLRYYYATNLETLIGIKAKYDPGCFFDFGMSIPKS